MRQLRRRQHGRRGALPQLRDLARSNPSIDQPGSLTLRSGCRARFSRTALLLLALGLAGTSATLAADPTADPGATTRPATCAERFPAEGPAGVDVRLGCIVGEIVGAYTPADGGSPTPLSSYAITVGVAIAAGVLLAWLAGRFVARRAARRLAPVLPAEWWVCASCSSVNGAGVTRCYSCGSGRPPGPTLTTDDTPSITQSFGSTRKRG